MRRSAQAYVTSTHRLAPFSFLPISLQQIQGFSLEGPEVQEMHSYMLCL